MRRIHKKNGTKEQRMRRGRKHGDGHIIRSTKKRRAAVFATVVILMAAAGLAGFGILAADYNSRLMGWNESRTELAFAAGGDRLDVTLMGTEYELDTSGLRQVQRVCASVQSGLEMVKPAPARLLDMLFSIAVRDYKEGKINL